MTGKKQKKPKTVAPGSLAMAEPQEHEQKKDNSGKEALKSTGKFVDSVINTVYVSAKNMLLTVCSLIKGLFDFIKRKAEEGKQANQEKKDKPEQGKGKKKSNQKESQQQNDSQQEKNPEMKVAGRAISHMIKEVGKTIGKLISSFLNMCKKLFGFAGKQISRTVSKKKRATKKPGNKVVKTHQQVKNSGGRTEKEKLQKFSDSLPKIGKRKAPKWQESGCKSAEKNRPSKKSKYDLSDTKAMVDKALGRKSSTP